LRNMTVSAASLFAVVAFCSSVVRIAGCVQERCELSCFRSVSWQAPGRFGGAPYRELQRNLADADLTRLRDAKIMIVEENESFVARTGYLNELRAVVNRP
jgi:hypothetical protein